MSLLSYYDHTKGIFGREVQGLRRHAMIVQNHVDCYTVLLVHVWICTLDIANVELIYP